MQVKIERESHTIRTTMKEREPAIQCARNAILDRSRYVRIELLERYHALKGVLNIGIDFQHFDWMPVAAKETTRNEATINTSRDSEFKEHLM